MNPAAHPHPNYMRVHLPPPPRVYTLLHKKCNQLSNPNPPHPSPKRIETSKKQFIMLSYPVPTILLNTGLRQDFCLICTMFSSRQVSMASSHWPKSPPPKGFKYVEEHWEAADVRQGRAPVSGHTGIFAYHCDDCLCSMGVWPCLRDGSIWSCCGSTDRYSRCTGDKQKNNK